MAVEFDVVEVTARRGPRSLRTETQTRTTLVINGLVPDKPLPVYLAGPAPLSYVRLVVAGENVGWDKAVNAGLALSTAPYVVLMNDDTEVRTKDWLPKMREVFEDDPSVGIVGPATDTRWPQGRHGKTDPPWVVVKPEFNNADNGGMIIHSPLSFFCVMLSRKCIVKTGYMDERFAGSYGCSDDDYQMRAHLMGFKLAVRTDVYVHHEGSATFGTERRAAEAPRNIQLLREKWKGEIA